MTEKSCNVSGGKEEEKDENKKRKDKTKTERSADYVRQTLIKMFKVYKVC